MPDTWLLKSVNFVLFRGIPWDFIMDMFTITGFTAVVNME